MLAGFSFIFGIYSSVQALVNFLFSKKKRGNRPDWTYQNKEICRKTFKGHALTAIVMFVFAFIFLLLKK